MEAKWVRDSMGGSAQVLSKVVSSKGLGFHKDKFLL